MHIALLKNLTEKRARSTYAVRGLYWISSCNRGGRAIKDRRAIRRAANSKPSWQNNLVVPISERQVCVGGSKEDLAMKIGVQVAGFPVRAAIAGAVISICSAGSALAQQNSSNALPLNLATPISAAAANSPASEAASSEAQAAPAPAGLAFFSGTELSGFVDTYYSYNFNKPGKACATVGGVAVFNCLRNFDVAHNSFSLNLMEVALEKKPTAQSRGGFRVDLDYGPTAAMVHAFEPGGLSIFQNVEQAYVSFLAPTGTGLQIDFGKFVTHNGAEVIETKDNWNYSRGLLFAWAIPYYHTGVRASYSPSDKVSVMGEVTNGWNNAVDNNTGKTVGGEITIKPIAALSIIGNYTGGPEQTDDNDDWRHLVDAVVTYTATPQVSVMANYDYARDKVGGADVTWQGVAGYLKYQANDMFALVPRVEYFDDKDGFSTGVVQKVKEATITAELKHKDGVMMRIEYRHDFSDVPFFIKEAGSLKKNQDTFTIGVVYAFSTKAP